MPTWTYDVTTEIGQVRLLIGDRDIDPTSDAQFSDEEIQAFLDMGGSVLMGASKALEAWAGAVKTTLASETIGEYSYKNTSPANMLKLADKYASQDASIPYFNWAEMDLASLGGPGIV